MQTGPAHKGARRRKGRHPTPAAASDLRRKADVSCPVQFGSTSRGEVQRGGKRREKLGRRVSQEIKESGYSGAWNGGHYGFFFFPQSVLPRKGQSRELGNKNHEDVELEHIEESVDADWKFLQLQGRRQDRGRIRPRGRRDAALGARAARWCQLDWREAAAAAAAAKKNNCWCSEETALEKKF